MYPRLDNYKIFISIKLLGELSVVKCKKNVSLNISKPPQLESQFVSQAVGKTLAGVTTVTWSPAGPPTRKRCQLHLGLCVHDEVFLYFCAPRGPTGPLLLLVNPPRQTGTRLKVLESQPCKFDPLCSITINCQTMFNLRCCVFFTVERLLPETNANAKVSKLSKTKRISVYSVRFPKKMCFVQ